MTDFFNLPDGLSMESLRKILELQSVTNQNQLTNADRLRAMSDEELATHFALKQPCPHDRFCGDYDCKSFEDCHDCWLDWLKAEVEE